MTSKKKLALARLLDEPTICKNGKPHLWKLSSYSQSDLSEVCSRCEQRRDRKPTQTEAAELRRKFRIDSRPGVHKVWHAFQRAMGDKKGYELMGIAERWAARHPDKIFVTGIDDAHFASSSLVFVIHDDENHEVRDMKKRTSTFEHEWMGISVIVVPQCTGEPPMTFFLYPGHLHGLVGTLTTLKKKMQAVPAVRREAARWRRWTKKTGSK